MLDIQFYGAMIVVMKDIEPTESERVSIQDPKLVHGLVVAAGNLLTYGVRRVAHELDPDPDAAKPVRRPNFELRESLERFRES